MALSAFSHLSDSAALFGFDSICLAISSATRWYSAPAFS
jgi:hypothetical protein